MIRKQTGKRSVKGTPRTSSRRSPTLKKKGTVKRKVSRAKRAGRTNGGEQPPVCKTWRCVPSELTSEIISLLNALPLNGDWSGPGEPMNPLARLENEIIRIRTECESLSTTFVLIKTAESFGAPELALTDAMVDKVRATINRGMSLAFGWWNMLAVGHQALSAVLLDTPDAENSTLFAYRRELERLLEPAKPLIKSIAELHQRLVLYQATLEDFFPDNGAGINLSGLPSMFQMQDPSARRPGTDGVRIITLGVSIPGQSLGDLLSKAGGGGGTGWVAGSKREG